MCFNEILKEDETILVSANCTLKSFINFTIVDKSGVLLVCDKRIVFGQIKGEHIYLVQDFDYKLITSFAEKKDDDGNKYMIFKYNGDRVKILDIKDNFEKISETISKNQRIM